MAIVVKQNQIQVTGIGSKSNCDTAAESILQAVVNLFDSLDGWTLVEDVNVWISSNSGDYPKVYTAMLQNSSTNEYMRLWFGISYNDYSQYRNFYLTDTNQTSLYDHIYVHKNNLFRYYHPSDSVKYYAHSICNIMCGISDNTISKELGSDLGLKLPLFELFYDLESNSNWLKSCSLPSEGGGLQTYLSYSAYYNTFYSRTLKLSIISDNEDSKFVFIINAYNNYSEKLRWSSYNGELITPANENDQYLQCAVFNSYPDTKLRAVFRAVDGSIQFGQYDTVLDGIALPAGAASDEGIVASPLFLSSQLESAGLDVPNVDNGSGYKGQIKTDWLLVSNSQVAGTTHNQGTWLNVGGGILVPWSPDAGSPFIS